mmetsp:Transcript_57560/g.62174  ORF Transcript_57560/g.62174 Transcript_57560/m.62174 type:complete len:98 (+) Transcript_57560:1779-2072(+)
MLMLCVIEFAVPATTLLVKAMTVLSTTTMTTQVKKKKMMDTHTMIRCKNCHGHVDACIIIVPINDGIKTYSNLRSYDCSQLWWVGFGYDQYGIYFPP